MELLLSLIGFVVVSAITPGPNNLLLASSGIRFGWRRTMPHILGIHVGIYLLVVLCGLGLGQLLLASPTASLLLKGFGSAYLIYLALQILTSLSVNPADVESARPMRLIEATVFQFTNPKAWMMATAGLNITLAIEANIPRAVVILCLGFATIGVVCNLFWVGLGASVRACLDDPVHRNTIRIGLALLTGGSVLMFWAA
jgi:threonine/homoserine/homoserine lactone efflux protein